MEWVEVTAKTIEEAKDSALDHLGVDESLAEFEIVDEPQKGWFGRIKVEARVRARVRPTQPRPKADRRRRRGPESSGKGGGKNKGGSGRRDNRSSNDRKKQNKAKPSKAEESSTAATVGSREPRGADNSAKAGRKQRSSNNPAEVPEVNRSKSSSKQDAATPPTGASTGDRPKQTTKPDDTVANGAIATAVAATAGAGVAATARSTKNAATSETAATRRPAEATAPSTKNPTRPASPDSGKTSTATGEAMQEDVTVEEQADIVWGFLEGLLDAFDVDGEITQTTIDDETVELSVLGDDLGLLIGPKGNTLQAIQELSRTAVQRQVVSAPGRVRLDVAQYRQKRREALARFVTVQAEETRDAGVQRALEPMNAADRKVVHDTVNEIDGVHTISEGQDPSRRVVIIPDGE